VAQPPAPYPTAQPGVPGQTTQPFGRRKLTPGKLAGIIVGSVAAVLLLCCGIGAMLTAFGNGSGGKGTNPAAAESPMGGQAVGAPAPQPSPTTPVAEPSPTPAAKPSATTPKLKTSPSTHKPSPTPTKKPTVNLCGAPKNPWNYNFCGGSTITNPPSDFCSYFECINNFWNGKGYVIQCNDGMFSKSGGRSGSCSYHSGNRRPLYK
jgi:hypothetical protein